LFYRGREKRRKKYLGDYERFHEHNYSARGHSQQTDNVHGTEHIEDYIAGSGKSLAREGEAHLFCAESLDIFVGTKGYFLLSTAARP